MLEHDGAAFTRPAGAILTGLGMLVLTAQPLAQGVVLGEFRWQVQPYCNVLTLTVTQVGAQYRVEGTDDQCGAPKRAAVTGLAFPNPDGSLGLGVTVLMTPGAIPWHLDVALDAAGNGTWRDASGQSGNFRLTPGNGTGGSPRPQAPPLNRLVDDPASEDVGGWPSVVITPDGRPLVSHHNASTGALRFTRCMDPDCRAATSRDIDGVAGHVVGRFSSLAIGADGMPVISHHDHTIGALRITHCEDIDCLAVTSVTADTGPGVRAGVTTALAIGQDGVPIVAHSLDVTGAGTGSFPHGLRVTHCGDVRCTTSTSHTVEVAVSPQLSTGGRPAIVVGADGLPVITHGSVETTIKSPLDQLRVSRCLNASCSSATTTNRAVGGSSSSIVVAGSWPFIAFDAHYRFFSGSLGDGVSMIRCLDPACATGSTATLAAPPTDYTASVAVGLAGTGLPVVAYSSALAAVRVVRCTDAGCTARDVATVDPTPVPTDLSLAIPATGARHPVVAYHDPAAQALRVVICRSSGCK